MSQEIFVSSEARSFLREGAKWAKFVAIFGFIFVGFYVIMALMAFMGGSMFAMMAAAQTGMMGASIGIMYGTILLVVALIYFFPIFFLYQFATKTLAALASEDAYGIAQGMRFMKNYFKYCGILMIVGLAICVLAILGTIIMAAAM